MARKQVPRTFAGIVDGVFQLGAKLSRSQRLHVYKVGGGEDADERADEVIDLSFTTIHTVEDFQGSEYETALSYDPQPQQESLPDMESREVRAQPVEGVVINREERTYGLTIHGTRKEIVLEPAHGIKLKTIEIINGHPINYVCHWIAKGIGWKQITGPLMELAHNGVLSAQFTAYSQQQIDTLAKKERQKKSHPGQADIEDAITEPEKPKRSRAKTERTFGVVGGEE